MGVDSECEWQWGSPRFSRSILPNCCNQPSISRYFIAKAPSFALLGHGILDKHLVCQIGEVFRLAVGEKV